MPHSPVDARRGQAAHGKQFDALHRDMVARIRAVISLDYRALLVDQKVGGHQVARGNAGSSCCIGSPD